MINVAGMEYAVSYVPGHEINGLTGLVRHDDQIIEIAQDCSPDVQAETLLHEILHCVDVATSSRERLSEEQVHRISRCLFSVFRDEENWSMLECIQNGNK